MKNGGSVVGSDSQMTAPSSAAERECSNGLRAVMRRNGRKRNLLVFNTEKGVFRVV